MPDKVSYAIKWDVLGMTASLFCAIHCLLLPLLITTLPLLGIELLENPAVEICTLVISLLAGVVALYTGYKKQHHRLWPIPVFVIGMIAMISGNLDIEYWNTSEAVFKSVGITCILTAHIANWKYRSNCNKHHCIHTPDSTISN